MIKISKHLLLIVVISLLISCAATGPLFTDAPAPSSSEGLIYIYRIPSSAFSGRDSYFYVNDINVADLSINGYTYFYLPPGNYEIKQKWPIDMPGGSLNSNLSLSAGETVYFMFGTASNWPRIKWFFGRVDESTGREQIRGIRYQKARGVKQLYRTLNLEGLSHSLLGEISTSIQQRENTDRDYFGPSWSVHARDEAYFACINNHDLVCQADHFQISKDEFEAIKAETLSFKTLYIKYHPAQ